MTQTRTPGPWVLEQNEKWPFEMNIHPNIATISRYAYGTSDKCLADVRAAKSFPHSQRDTVASLVAEQEANACLIAAAPDMLPITQLVASLPIHDHLPDDVPVTGVDGFYITQGDVRAARATIAKATGEPT